MKNYLKTISVLVIAAALIGVGGAYQNITDALSAKTYWEDRSVETDENLSKLEDGLNQLKENEAAYYDGIKTLEQGKKDLAEGKKTLEAGYEEYYAGLDTYNSGLEEYNEGKAKLAANTDAYIQGKKDYAAGQKRLAAGEKELAEGKKKLDAGKTSLKSLKELLQQIKQLQSSYTGQWRPGFEQLKAQAKDYAITKDNMDKAKVNETIENLKLALAAYNAIENLMNNGATPEQAIQMIAASSGKKPAEVKYAIDNYALIVAAKTNVDKLMAGLSESEAEETVFATDAGAAAKDAYNGVKNALKNGATSVDQAAALVAQNMGSTDATVIEKIKAAYTGVKQQVDVLMAQKDQDTAAQMVAASTGKSKDEVLAAYNNYDAAVAAKTNYDRLQKTTADDGIKYDECVAAVASATGKGTDVVNTAYNTVKGLGGVDAVNANIEKLTELGKDGGSIDQLAAGRATIQGYINQIITGVQGNAQLKERMDPSHLKGLAQVKQMVAGTDQQFENGSDAFFDQAIPLLEKLINDIQGEIDEGQEAYDAGQAELAAGRKELAAGKAKLNEYEAGQRKLADAAEQLAAGRAKLDAAEQQLADGEKALEEGAKAIKDGEKKLAEFEDGRDQVIDGLKQVVATEPDGTLESIASRLGKGYSYMKDNNKDLDIPQGFVAVDAARAYKADNADAVTTELTGRIYAQIAGIVASILCIAAGLLGLLKKFKAAGVLGILGAIAAVVAKVMASNAGLTFSHVAGSQLGALATYAITILAIIAAVHGVSTLLGGNAAKGADD